MARVRIDGEQYGQRSSQQQTGERCAGARPSVRGVGVDAQTRCAHYHTERDVIAIRCPRTGEYYACHRCHEAVTGRQPYRWPREQRGEPAVLCGVCGAELSVREYLGCDHACPRCDAPFNPGCAAHYHLYFEL